MHSPTSRPWWRRSYVPLIALLVVGCIGVALWLEEGFLERASSAVSMKHNAQNLEAAHPNVDMLQEQTIATTEMPTFEVENGSVGRTEEVPTTVVPIPVATEKECVHLDMGHMVKRHAQPNACYSRAEVQEMIRNLVYNFTAMMEEHNLDYWLCSGTLLGSYRSKGLIPYDVDADVGVTSESLDTLRHLKVDILDVYELQVLHSKIHFNGGDANIPGRFIDRRSGFYIDIFEFLASQKVTKIETTKNINVVVDPTNPTIVYKEDGALTLQANKTMSIRMEITTIEESTTDYLGPIKSVCWAGCALCPEPQHFIVPKDWIYPRQRCQFDDRQVWCPANPEEYLRMLYGDNFMRPDHRRLRRSH